MPGRHHSTQFNGRKVKSIAARLVSYGTGLWHVARYLTLAFCAGTAGPIGAGKTPFDSDRRRQDVRVDCTISSGGHGLECRQTLIEGSLIYDFDQGYAICNAGLTSVPSEERLHLTIYINSIHVKDG